MERQFMLEDDRKPEDLDWAEIKDSPVWFNLQVYLRHQQAECVRKLSSLDTKPEHFRDVQVQKIAIEGLMDAPDYYIEQGRRAKEQALKQKELEDNAGRRTGHFNFRRLVPTGRRGD
jgi:hypothetical protein